LRPFGARVFAQPFTPERILAALGKVPARWPVPPAHRPSPEPADAIAAAAEPAAEAASAAEDDSGKPGLLGRMLGRSKG
jgi:hypothetical protein